MNTIKFNLFAVAAFLLAATPSTFAASGCATVIEVKSVNVRPDDDTYRLDKRGFSTGGQVATLLGNFGAVGALASVVADVAVGVVGTAVRVSGVANDRNDESMTEQYKDVFEVTYKPDFGDELTIVIRKSEMKRFSIENGARVVMFDPDLDRTITTDDGPVVRRTRPTIEVPTPGFWSLTYKVEMPDGVNFSDKYIASCFKGQTGAPYRTMSAKSARAFASHAAQERADIEAAKVVMEDKARPPAKVFSQEELQANANRPEILSNSQKEARATIEAEIASWSAEAKPATSSK